ncbi:MAG: hypothetical protein MJ237_00105 [bacterium]|nr:hypothetical protein [bacterium]
MRKLFLFGFIFTLISVAQASASITVKESTDANYLINAGYSQVTAEDVFILKNRSLGRPIEPLYDKPQNSFIRGVKSIWSYVDPSIETPDRLHHDIKLSPSSSDL